MYILKMISLIFVSFLCFYHIYPTYSFVPINKSFNIRSNQASTLQMSILEIDPNYNLAAGSAVIGLICGVLEDQKSNNDGIFKSILTKISGASAVLFTIFGIFVAYQTTTLRFTFDDTNKSFSLVKAGNSNDNKSIGENIVVGGENSWKYYSFKNYDFLPSKSFPILVYFKEDQTPRENWVAGPDILKVDNLDGQVHYFPCIANADQLEANFKKETNKQINK